MPKNVLNGVIEYLKEKLDTNYIEVIHDYSVSLYYKDKHPCLDDDSLFGLVWTGEEMRSPFYRVNVFLVSKVNGKYNFFKYNAFVIANANEKLQIFNEEISPIFEETDHILFQRITEYGFYGDSESFKKAIVFLKGNSILGYTFIDDHKHIFDFKGEIVPKTYFGRSFLTACGNKIIKVDICTGQLNKDGEIKEYIDCINVYQNVIYQDKKNITGVEIVNNSKNNDGYVCRVTDHFAAILSFEDGTKRLWLETDKGDSTSKYFKDLKLIEGFINLTASEFQKEKPENRKDFNYITNDPLTDQDYGSTDYFIPGLTFGYVTDAAEGEYIVTQDGHKRVKSRREIKKVD